MRQWNARAHARMTKEIPSDTQTYAQRGKKRHVRARQRLPERRGGRLVTATPHQRSNIDAVGMQGFVTAEARPVTADRRIAQEMGEHLLMIALQGDKLGR